MLIIANISKCNAAYVPWFLLLGYVSVYEGNYVISTLYAMYKST